MLYFLKKALCMDTRQIEHLISLAEDRNEFHLTIAPIIEKFVKRLTRLGLGFQTDDTGKIINTVTECTIEWIDGTTSTAWLVWDSNIPLCHEDNFNFVFEKPRLDIYKPLDTSS